MPEHHVSESSHAHRDAVAQARAHTVREHG